MIVKEIPRVERSAAGFRRFAHYRTRPLYAAKPNWALLPSPTPRRKPTNQKSPTLAELDASIGGSSDVPEGEIAVRYYSDEALLTAIRLRRNGRTTG